MCAFSEYSFATSVFPLAPSHCDDDAVRRLQTMALAVLIDGQVDLNAIGGIGEGVMGSIYGGGGYGVGGCTLECAIIRA